MFFNDIVGQEILKSRLIQTVKENRISHAWLLFGPEGNGALPLAIAFAGYILCTNRGAKDACGSCISCNKTSKYIHPDLHFVFPVNKTKNVDKDSVTSDDFLPAWRNFLNCNPYGRLTQWYEAVELDNKQGIINTDESKKLSGKLALKSYESDYKVVIIWQPEKMNDQAANKLLKLLEEPPPMTLFLLVSENPDVLLSTVRSRCISVKVPGVSDTDMLATLKERHKIEGSQAVEIVRLAEGSYRKAQEIITQGDDMNYNYIKFRDLMRSCFKSSISELIKHAEELSGLNRENQKSFLEYGLHTIRQSIVLHYEKANLAYISDREQEFTPKFAPFIDGNNVIAITDELNRAIRDIERNANGRIVFLDLALKLAGLIKQ